MNDNTIKIKKTSDIGKICNELLKSEYQLDNFLAEIEKLKRGKVEKEDTLRRSALGSYVSATVQQLENYVLKNDIHLSKKRKSFLKRLAFKSDKVLRENIVMQSVPPLDVINFKNVPIRYSYSSFGRREQRWGYGLHLKPFNEEGDSITIANMPKSYTQSIHNHKVSEYCLSVDSKTEGIYFPGGKREKIYTTKKSQILHFSATTPHTLRNPLNKSSRNITFKHSSALTDWRPISKLNGIKTIRARILKGDIYKINDFETHKEFKIKDSYYNYKIEIIRLKKGALYKNKHPFDQFIFIMNGRLTVSHKSILKSCKKNDFIVIDKNTEYVINTNTFCRLYTVVL